MTLTKLLRLDQKQVQLSLIFNLITRWSEDFWAERVWHFFDPWYLFKKEKLLSALRSLSSLFPNGRLKFTFRGFIWFLFPDWYKVMKKLGQWQSLKLWSSVFLGSNKFHYLVLKFPDWSCFSCFHDKTPYFTCCSLLLKWTLTLNWTYFSNLFADDVFHHIVSVGTDPLKQEVINCVNPAEQTKQTEAFPAQTQTHKLKLYFYLQTHKRFLFVFNVSPERRRRSQIDVLYLLFHKIRTTRTETETLILKWQLWYTGVKINIDDVIIKTTDFHIKSLNYRFYFD